jgi:hypothetical protein
MQQVPGTGDAVSRGALKRRSGVIPTVAVFQAEAEPALNEAEGDLARGPTAVSGKLHH